MVLSFFENPSFIQFSIEYNVTNGLGYTNDNKFRKRTGDINCLRDHLIEMGKNLDLNQFKYCDYDKFLEIIKQLKHI